MLPQLALAYLLSSKGLNLFGGLWLVALLCGSSEPCAFEHYLSFEFVCPPSFARWSWTCVVEAPTRLEWSTSTPPGERRGTHKLKILRNAQKHKAQTSRRKAPQVTNLLRSSNPWRTEEMLRLAEVARSCVCEALTLNYECTQVGLLLP